MENMRNDNVFKVTKSRLVFYVTLGACVLLVAVFVPAWYMVFAEPFILVPFIIMTLASVSVFGMLIYFYMISPKRIELTADSLVLHRVWGKRRLRYADIADVGLWKGKSSEMIRLCGSGAFCGYIGWFSGGGLDLHFEYVGSYSDAFYVKTRRGRTYLLSCDDAGQVVRRIEDKIDGAAA